MKYFLLFLALFLTACNAPRERVAAAPKPATPEEIVLSESEQAAAKLDIHPAETTSAPEMLRANGRIALADDRTWHVGVRTDGIVVGGLRRARRLREKGRGARPVPRR